MRIKIMSNGSMYDPKRSTWIDKDNTIKYYEGGRFPVCDPTLLKKRRTNPLGEDVYLYIDGSISRDEDKIVAAQRIWLHHAYKPGGKMYQLKKENSVWNKNGDCASTDC